MEKLPHTSYVSILLILKFGSYGIGYGIGQKYRPIRVSVSVSDLNQKNGFGRSLRHWALAFSKVGNWYN